MTKAVWTKFITDNAGAVVEGASVTVFLSDGITPATIYSDPAGSAKANPFLTPAGGKAEFYADPGIYVIQASKDGKTATWNNEEIGHARRDLDLSDIESASAARGNLGLGTAATRDVTTSDTDTTVGRLLEVGDFGSANSPIAYAPGTLDSLYEFSAYYQVSSSSAATDNFPFSVGGNLQVYRGVNDQYCTQEYSIVVGAVARKAIRHRNNGTWRPWKEIYHTGNIVGTVSQSGGLPTGGIMQYATSGSNKAAKYTDGMLITWNDNAVITADPVAYVGTPTSIESGKLKIGRWY